MTSTNQSELSAAASLPSRGSDHIADIRAEEATVALVEADQSRLRGAGRAAVGVTGIGRVGTLRASLAGTGVGLYPAAALGLLVMTDQLQQAVLTTLGPEITNALGMPRSTFAAVVALRALLVTLIALPFAAVVQRRAVRGAVCIGSAVAWSIFTGLTGFVVSVWGLLLVLGATGAVAASVVAVHQPLLVDSYPPSARVRMLSLYQGANKLGDFVSPLIIGFCVAIVGLTWRGAFLGVAIVALLATIAASKLRDPGFGGWDTEQVRSLVRDAEDLAADQDLGDVQLGFFEIGRRLILIPTVRGVLAAYALLGMFTTPFITYLAFFLQERWELGPGARGLFGGGMQLFSLPALAWFSRRGEGWFRSDPGRLLRFSALAMGVTTLAVGASIVMPVFPLVVVCLGITFAGFAVVIPATTMPLFAVVPAEMRSHLGAFVGIALVGVGGGAGLLLLGGVERRFGAAGAILALALPGLLGGLTLRSSARLVNADLDRMVDGLVEEEEVRVLLSRGAPLPMLACRHIDFSYGQLQVLFDVNFTVDEGEIVALLGTNGAGKSTLLRVISGLGLPSSGSVRLNGRDITFIDAERRVAQGIIQIPGGRAVFGPMTVAENLRSFGYSHGRDRRAIEAGIDASFDAFPVLAERRNQIASTLSGGQQQMLGLATAFIVRPRLLLIDELSLGLAPKVVGELLEMVRRINAGGTAVVLVEQSVNVALSVVQHAYFMEKGEVRFDGAADQLLARPDLLRSVFLEGANRGLHADVDQ